MRMTCRERVHDTNRGLSTALAGLLWISMGCTSAGPPGDEVVATTQGALKGPTCDSFTSTGCWKRITDENYTVFDFGSLMACAVISGSNGPSSIPCQNGVRQCPINNFTFGCSQPTAPGFCNQSTSTQIKCWNRNWDELLPPVLSSHIQSVAIGRTGTQTRALAALTEDHVVHWTTGTASQTLATFHAGFNTWSGATQPIDDNGNFVCLTKIVAIDIPTQTGVESHLLGLGCSNTLFVHGMGPSGAWSPAGTSLQPWTLLPPGLTWQDISRYTPRVQGSRWSATLLSTTGQVWRVGRAQFSGSGIRTFDAPIQLPPLPDGRVATGVAGAYVLTDGGHTKRIAYSDEFTTGGGWEWFDGGQPTDGPTDVAKILVESHPFSVSGRRDLAVYQVNQRLYNWQDARFESGAFWNADWNTGSDWDPGFLKGTCSTGNSMVGLSSDVNGGAHKVLCRAPGPTGVTANAQYITGLAGPGDARRATRADLSAGVDWAPGFYKFECGVHEFVSGVSQSPGSHAFHGIRCSGPSDFSDGLCMVNTVDNGDDRASHASDDWDVGFYKGECGLNSYVAGVSVSPSTARAHSILCCQRSPGPSL